VPFSLASFSRSSGQYKSLPGPHLQLLSKAGSKAALNVFGFRARAGHVRNSICQQVVSSTYAELVGRAVSAYDISFAIIFIDLMRPVYEHVLRDQCVESRDNPRLWWNVRGIGLLIHHCSLSVRSIWWAINI
jgi:hypothetical protein